VLKWVYIVPVAPRAQS